MLDECRVLVPFELYALRRAATKVSPLGSAESDIASHARVQPGWRWQRQHTRKFTLSEIIIII